MNPGEVIFEVMFKGDRQSRALVARDVALSNGIRWQEFTDDEAEFERVRCATNSVGVEVRLPDARPPYALRLVRCGGLMAIEPSQGGDLKGWLHAKVARLWRRAHRQRELFTYVARDGQLMVKRQRWETRDYIDLGRGFSPAWLSGFAPDVDGKTIVRGVSSPKHDVKPQAAPELNCELDFGGRP